MCLYSLSLNTDDLSVARKHLASKLPQVKRSHLAEALAASLGFNTSIALQTAIRANSAKERRYQRFDAQAFFIRLDSLGYALNEMDYAFLSDARFPKTVSLNFVLTSSGAVHSTLSELGQKLDQLVMPLASEVDLCKQVLSEITVFRKTPGTSSSYNFKHRIEEAFGTYISNGALIQAAVELGMKVKTMEGPNVLFYVSDKAFKDAISHLLTRKKQAVGFESLAST